MHLDVKFQTEDMTLDADFSEASQSFDADFGTIQTVTKLVGGVPYEGDYTVTPKVEAQTIPTKDKVMLDDVTVRAIPVFRVSNTSGGTTVYIAKEV
jgi:hypothetical protein